MEQESNRQKTTGDVGGGLHPAVDGQSLGENFMWKVKGSGKVLLQCVEGTAVILCCLPEFFFPSCIIVINFVVVIVFVVVSS